MNKPLPLPTSTHVPVGSGNRLINNNRLRHMYNRRITKCTGNLNKRMINNVFMGVELGEV